MTTYTYDAWGKITSVTGSQSTTIGAANPFRYRGGTIMTPKQGCTICRAGTTILSGEGF
ncbi:MAG: hypothetical protein ACOX45_09965 [Acutalibacteraceae bacterium]